MSNQKTMKVKRDTKETNERCRLFIRNLSYNTTKLDLVNAFECFGVVLEAHIPKNRETGESRGFGYVSFENPSSAQSAHQKVIQTNV
jgi:RNA-binding protein Musashi